jgi:hypothetical protein
MKKALFTLLAALALPLLAETIEGQKRITNSLVTWNSAANTGKTRIRFHAGQVALDTSATGQTGAWKRIDNTADSCSQPFLIASDTSGRVVPVWEFRLWQKVKSVHATLGMHVYRVQTRERQYLGPISGKQVAGWTPWSYLGQNGGYADVTVQDSILMRAPRTVTNSSQYSFGFVAGAQARLCPDNTPETSSAAGDSVIADSLRFTTR